MQIQDYINQKQVHLNAVQERIAHEQYLLKSVYQTHTKNNLAILHIPASDGTMTCIRKQLGISDWYQQRHQNISRLKSLENSLSLSLDSLITRLMRSTSALAKSQTTNSELKQDKSELEKTNSELKQTNSELKQDKSELEKTNSELEQTNSELEQTNSTLRDHKAQLLTACKELTLALEQTIE
jgi:chromosome segregation ATPase